MNYSVHDAIAPLPYMPPHNEPHDAIAPLQTYPPHNEHDNLNGNNNHNNNPEVVGVQQQVNQLVNAKNYNKVTNQVPLPSVMMDANNNTNSQ